MFHPLHPLKIKTALIYTDRARSIWKKNTAGSAVRPFYKIYIHEKQINNHLNPKVTAWGQ